MFEFIVMAGLVVGVVVLWKRAAASAAAKRTTPATSRAHTEWGSQPAVNQTAEERSRAEFDARWDQEMAKPLSAEVQALIDKHTPTLADKWNILVYEDDYGEPQFDKWEREERRFINSVLLRVLPTNFKMESMDGTRISYAINKAVAAHNAGGAE